MADIFVKPGPRALPDAITRAKAGDVIILEPGEYNTYNFLDKSLRIINPSAVRAADGTLTKLARFNMLLRPALNKAQTAEAAVELGLVSYASVALALSALNAWKGTPTPLPPSFDAYWKLWLEVSAALAYRAKTATFTVGAKTATKPVAWTANIGSKGIFTIKAGVPETYIEGVECGFARIGSTNNGAGIRTQGGSALSVRRSQFHDNQNGILTAPQFREAPNGEFLNFTNGKRYTRTGYNFFVECEFFNNGEGGGLVHDIYLNPAARQYVGSCIGRDCKSGHHAKHFQGGGVAINLANKWVDSDTVADLRSHCSVDSNSGHLYLVNNHCRKVATSASGTNIAHGNFHSNNRDEAPGGNVYVALGNKLESTVLKSTTHFDIESDAVLKPSPSDTVSPLTLPTPIEGLIDDNVGLAPKAGYRTNFVSSNAPALVVGTGNRTGFFEDGDLKQAPLGIVAPAGMTKAVFDALLVEIGRVKPAAKGFVDRSLALLANLDKREAAAAPTPPGTDPAPDPATPLDPDLSPTWANIFAADAVDDGLVTKAGVWTFEPLTALDARVLLNGEPTKNASGNVIAGTVLLVGPSGTLFCQASAGAVRYWNGNIWATTSALPVKPAPPVPPKTACELAQAEVILLKAQLVTSAAALTAAAGELATCGASLTAANAANAASDARTVAGLAALNAAVVALKGNDGDDGI